MIIDRYQYKGLKYQAMTGDKKAILDEHVISCKTGIPSLIWTIRFKNIDPTTKAYLEQAMYTDIDDLILKTHVNPMFLIHRNTGLFKHYYLTYAHEYAYYESPVKRIIPHTTVGTNDILEGGIVIPHVGAYVLVDNSVELSRRVRYMEARNSVTHNDYKLFSFTMVVKDLAKPIANIVSELVGGSNVTYNPDC